MVLTTLLKPSLNPLVLRCLKKFRIPKRLRSSICTYFSSSGILLSRTRCFQSRSSARACLGACRRKMTRRSSLNVGRVEGFVGGQSKQVLEPDVLLGGQVLSVAQEQVTAAFEVTPPGGRQFALQAAPDVVDGHAQRLDDVEVIVDERGARAALADLQFVWVVHVDDHAADAPGPLLAEPFEELLQGSAIPATADPDDAALDSVGDQRQVAVSLLLGHFVDSQVGDPVEVPLAQQPYNVSDLRLLHRSPVYSGQLRHVLDRHALGQGEQPTLESPSATCVMSCDPRLHAPHSALRTAHPITRHPDIDPMPRDIQIPQPHPGTVVISAEA